MAESFLLYVGPRNVKASFCYNFSVAVPWRRRLVAYLSPPGFDLGFFLHGEGPRSRCYGRTTALRLFVQPYDEDEHEQFFTTFYK
jgi:hypothetical protein